MTSPKALRDWCRLTCAGYPNVEIRNMSTSFRDGLVFCAIIHRHRPDLLDFSSLSRDNVYQNNKLAFEIAETKLGIPALLDPSDLLSNRVPDCLSILTYLYQYYHFFNRKSYAGPVSLKPSHVSILNNLAKTPAGLKPRKSLTDLKTCREDCLSSSRPRTVCSLCFKPVHLIQRYLINGKVYHRSCFRCRVCHSTLLPGSYTRGSETGFFFCSHHTGDSLENWPKSRSEEGFFSLGGSFISSTPHYTKNTETQDEPVPETELRDREDFPVGLKGRVKKPARPHRPPAAEPEPADRDTQQEVRRTEELSEGASLPLQASDGSRRPVPAPRRMLDPSAAPAASVRNKADGSPTAGKTSVQNKSSPASSHISNRGSPKVRTNHPWLNIVHPGPWTQLPPAPAPIPAPRTRFSARYKPKVVPPNPFAEDMVEDTVDKSQPETDALNPFADDMKKDSLNQGLPKVVSTNPFEEDMIEDTLDQGLPKKVALNPFAEDMEEDTMKEDVAGLVHLNPFIEDVKTVDESRKPDRPDQTKIPVSAERSERDGAVPNKSGLRDPANRPQQAGDAPRLSAKPGPQELAVPAAEKGMAVPVAEGVLAVSAAEGVLANPAAGGVLAVPVAEGVLAVSAAEGVLANPAAGGVLAVPAAEGVIAIPGAEGVLAVPAAEGVLANPAAGGVLAVPAAEGVIAIPGAEGVLAVPAAEGVIAIPGAEGVLAVSGAEGVIAVPGAEGVLAVSGAEGGIAVPGAEGVLAVPGAEGVIAIPGAEGGIAVPGAEGVLAVPAAEGVIAIPGAEGVLAVPGAEGVIAIPGAEGVLAVPGAEGGIAIPGAEGVLAVPGAEGGISIPGAEGVLAVPAAEGVLAVPGAEGVLAVPGAEGVLAVPGAEGVLAVPGAEGVLAIPGAEGVLAVPGAEGVLAVPGAEGVLAVPGAEGVLAVPGAEGVLAVPGAEGVLAVPGAEGVIAVPASEGVIAGPASEDALAVLGAGGVLAVTAVSLTEETPVQSQLMALHGDENMRGSLQNVTEAAAWTSAAPQEAQCYILPRSLSVPAMTSSSCPSSSLTVDLMAAQGYDQVSSSESKLTCKGNLFDRKSAMPKSKTFQSLPSRRGPAPGHGFPLIRRKVQTDQDVSTEDLRSEMRELDQHLQTLEQRGVQLERNLRECKNDQQEEQMLVEWFSLVREKNSLVRRDTELIQLAKQQKLEERQADVEYQLRCLLNKPEGDWSGEDRGQEQQLMDELVTIIEERDEIISSLDQDRLREQEEDVSLDTMKTEKEPQKEGLKDLKKAKGKFKPKKVFKLLSH